MSYGTNRYPGTCHACGARVPEGKGKLEYIGFNRRGRGRYQLWCSTCFNSSDCSSEEDRCCGNRAYEDACARACGYNDAGW